MAARLRIRDLCADRLLLTRESARQIETRLREFMKDAASGRRECGCGGVVVDFDGVAVCAPSCADEFVFVFKDMVVACVDAGIPALTIANPPARLSSMLRAVGRGQGMTVEEQTDGSWLLTDSGERGG